MSFKLNYLGCYQGKYCYPEKNNKIDLLFKVKYVLISKKNYFKIRFNVFDLAFKWAKFESFRWKRAGYLRRFFSWRYWKNNRKARQKNNIDTECFQSNAEHELVDKIHNAKSNGVKIILFNPGAFTHSSISLRDAILGVNIPLIEIHLSNIYGREEFREKSYFSDIALGVVSGFGKQSYLMAFQAAKNYLTKGGLMDIT